MERAEALLEIEPTCGFVFNTLLTLLVFSRDAFTGHFVPNSRMFIILDLLISSLKLTLLIGSASFVSSEISFFLLFLYFSIAELTGVIKVSILGVNSIWDSLHSSGVSSKVRESHSVSIRLNFQALLFPHLFCSSVENFEQKFIIIN